jgi:glycosyltransferase involved in cell wall biosynthesis
VRLPNPAAWLWDAAAMLETARRVRAFLKQTGAELVVTKGLFSHLYGGLAARTLGIPLIWHVQDFISERFLGCYRRAFALAARLLPDHVIADGAAIGRQLPRLKDRTSVILNGVNCDVFKPGVANEELRREFGFPAESIVIGHVGRMTPWKGQHYLIEAFARVVRDAPNAYLLLVGDPVFDSDRYQTELLELTAKLGLTEKVIFAGYRQDMKEVLAARDVFAFTSVEKDTSPLTLLSAMAAGLPIVAFDIEGVRELANCDDAEPLLSVPLKDTEALAASLSKLIADPELRQSLGVAARNQAEERFSLERHVAGIEQVFLHVCPGLRLSQRHPVATAPSDFVDTAGALPR